MNCKNHGISMFPCLLIPLPDIRYEKDNKFLQLFVPLLQDFCNASASHGEGSDNLFSNNICRGKAMVA